LTARVGATSTRSGAVFAEVAVDARLGVVRVRRLLGVYDAGRITNPKLADIQAIGGMVGGIGAALLKHTVTDPRDGRIANANLADHLVPVNADIPDLRAIHLDGEDREADPVGVKGLGEAVLVGVAPAVANAVSHATGRRVRELPITADALLRACGTSGDISAAGFSGVAGGEAAAQLVEFEALLGDGARLGGVSGWVVHGSVAAEGDQLADELGRRRSLYRLDREVRASPLL
jgi:hypothetical protein